MEPITLSTAIGMKITAYFQTCGSISSEKISPMIGTGKNNSRCESGHDGIGARWIPRSSQAARVPKTTAMKPVGRPNGQRTRPAYPISTSKAGKSAISGDVKIWKTNPIEMNVIATPASVESSAARGVLRRIHAPKKEVAISMMPPRNPAASETFQARSAF